MGQRNGAENRALGALPHGKTLTRRARGLRSRAGTRHAQAASPAGTSLFRPFGASPRSRDSAPSHEKRMEDAAGSLHSPLSADAVGLGGSFRYGHSPHADLSRMAPRGYGTLPACGRAASDRQLRFRGSLPLVPLTRGRSGLGHAGHCARGHARLLRGSPSADRACREYRLLNSPFRGLLARFRG